MVVLSAYVLQNVRLLLLSGIGKPYDPETGEGVVGKNYAYQTMSSVNVFFDGQDHESVHRRRRAGDRGRRVQRRQLRPRGLGFIGGGYIAQCRPAAGRSRRSIRPQGTPKWGAEWKKAAAKNYLRAVNISCHGSVMAHRGNYLDLDPTYRDSFGRPLLRMTFDFTDNELKMSRLPRRQGGGDRPGHGPARDVKKNYRTGSWSVVPYQTTHNTGGAIMGDNPTNSVVNKYLQSWDVPNLFVTRRGRLPAERRLQPDRHGGGAGLSGRRRHQEPVPEERRAAGARLKERSGWPRRIPRAWQRVALVAGGCWRAGDAAGAARRAAGLHPDRPPSRCRRAC